MYTSHCKWWQAWLLTPELFSLPSKQSKPCFCSPSAGILSQILSKWFADSDGLLWWTVSYDNKQGQHQQKLLHALSFEQRNTNLGVVISAQPVMSSRRPLTPAPPRRRGVEENQKGERGKRPRAPAGESRAVDWHSSREVTTTTHTLRHGLVSSPGRAPPAGSGQLSRPYPPPPPPAPLVGSGRAPSPLPAGN